MRRPVNPCHTLAPMPQWKGVTVGSQLDDNLVLIVEDDPRTASLVSIYLEKEGFITIMAGDGKTAIKIARKKRLCFVILDLMIPKVDGWEVCRDIRRHSDVPILMLTAREEEVDRVSGLTMGADDYMVKPFSPRELTARVKAILRRGRMNFFRETGELSAGKLVMDTEAHQVRLDGELVPLTPNEYKLLHALTVRARKGAEPRSIAPGPVPQ